MRRERELIATVLKQAEIDRKRIETMAAAERIAQHFEAEGRASSIRTQGEAGSRDYSREGEAEAKAMSVKARPTRNGNQAAVIDKLLTNMPEVVRALARSSRKCRQDHDCFDRKRSERRDAQDYRRYDRRAAQIPALFETLSGMKMSELLGKVKTIGQTQKPKGKFMALLERVATLVRANLNDLIDKAEGPS